MASRTVKQIIAIHILPNISRTKGNQAKKFDRLIEHNMRNIFLEKCSWETNPIPITNPKTPNLACLWINNLKFETFCFCCMSKFSTNKKNFKRRCWPLSFTSYKAFLKINKRSGTSLPASFSAWFLKKYTSHVIFYKYVVFYIISFTSWNIGQ